MSGSPVASAHAARVATCSARLLGIAEAAAPASWRLAVAAELRELTDADAAVTGVEGRDDAGLVAVGLDAGVVRAYRECWAALDVGIARLRALDRELWSRSTLWRRGELARSPYYNEFARPNGLRDSAGISLRLSGLWLRVALLRGAPLRRRRSVERQGRLLAAMLPTLRTGTALVAWRRRYARAATRAVDLVPEPVGLYAATGRAVHENPALVRAAGPRGSRPVAGLVARVVRRIAERARSLRTRAAPPPPDARDAVDGWRVGGCLLPELDGRAGTILVALQRTHDDDAGAVEALAARHILTAREVEVLRLLRQRRSNREIAAALRISECTARHHTESVLLKLGVHSRREVERLVAT